jgi:uncharacterized RDD family membrane protein YckC
MSSWFYVKDGQRAGPVKLEDLHALVTEGVVDGATLVWRAGMTSWARASEMAELGLPPPVLPPPLPPSATPPERSATGAGADMEGVSSWPEPPSEGAPRVGLDDTQGAFAAGAVAGPLAGFWARFLAKLVDVMILFGIGQGVEWGVARWVFEGPLPVPPDWAGFVRGLLWLLSINTLIGMVYTVYFLGRYEATPGKMLLGLRVVRAGGARMGFWRSLGRFWAEQVTGLTFSVGYVMAAFDDEKRALHDFIANTRVVRGARRED